MYLNFDFDTRDPLVLDRALLVYRQEGTVDKVAISEHRIINGKLKAGRFVRPEGLIKSDSMQGVWIEPNTLYVSNKQKVWTTPPQTVDWLQRGEDVSKKKMPQLLWRFTSENNLYVYRYRKVGDHYYLREPRLPNTYAGCRICMGSTQLRFDKMTQRQVMDLFWRTSFNGHGDNNNKYRGELRNVVAITEQDARK